MGSELELGLGLGFGLGLGLGFGLGSGMLTFLHWHPTLPKSPLLSPHAPGPRPPHALGMQFSSHLERVGWQSEYLGLQPGYLGLQPGYRGLQPGYLGWQPPPAKGAGSSR